MHVSIHNSHLLFHSAVLDQVREERYGAKSKAGKGKKGKQTSAADTTYKMSDNVLTSEESASATSNLSDKLSSTSESDEQ